MREDIENFINVNIKNECNIERCEYNECGNCNYCGDYWSLNDRNCTSFIDKYED